MHPHGYVDGATGLGFGVNGEGVGIESKIKRVKSRRVDELTVEIDRESAARSQRHHRTVRGYCKVNLICRQENKRTPKTAVNFGEVRGGCEGRPGCLMGVRTAKQNKAVWTKL